MRAFIPNYQLTTPASLADALALLKNEPGIWKPFAGGTDLMVLLEAGKLPHRNYINIWGLLELRGIEATDTHITLGALTTYTEIQANPILRSEFPMLCQAASETGGLAIQNRGTIGGNIINASPAADSPPALLAYDAEIELVSTRGSRWLPYQGFHTGYKQMHIAPDELLARIRLPRNTTGLTHYYRKVGTRKAQAISKVCFAAVGRTNNGQIAETRIAVGSVAPIVVRCVETENALNDRKPDAETIRLACASLAREISPIDDIRSTANYRLQVAKNLLTDFVSSALICGLFLVALAIPALAQDQGSLNGFMTGIRANAVKGSVIYKRDGSFDLEPGLKLEQYDVIKSDADSYCELLLQPGNYFRVGPDTALQILNAEIDKMKLKLNEGTISLELVTKDQSGFYKRPEAYELIRIITPDAEVFISGPGIFRITAGTGKRTELIVRNGEAVINGREVKKNRRAVASSESVSISQIDSKTEDAFDAWSHERADALVQANKLLKDTSPWAKKKKEGFETSVDLPDEGQRSSSPYVVSARPGAVTFVEDGIEFNRPPGPWEQITDKSQLEAGDTLRTDELSFAELMLFPDTHLRIDHSSEVLFEQLSNDSISIKLLRGSAILDVARFDRKEAPQITITGSSTTAVIAEQGNYRIDSDGLTIRDGKVSFNERSVGSCRKISSGAVSECDKKRSDNFDFWSRHRGEGTIYDGSATVSMSTHLARLRQYRFKHTGFWYQNPGQMYYTFVPFKSLLFRSPYGGSYSTALAPESFLKRDVRRVTLPSSEMPQLPPSRP
ncbi:MAG TPA: FAD binding domain-containing protein [Pyrinomonadaceae bacterium]